MIIIIAVEAVTEIIINGSIFDQIRAKIALNAQNSNNMVIGFINDLISCGYCFSVWVAALFAFFAPGDISGFLFADFIIKVFSIHRLSNIFHEFVSRWINRVPIMVSLQHVKIEEKD